MPLFVYTAVNDEGVHLSGELEADTPEEVKQSLLGNGLIVTRVSRKNTASSGGRNLFARFLRKKVSHKDIILFSKQFRTLLVAGVPMTQLLQILQVQTENPTLREAIADIARQINTGETLNRAFRSHSDIFPPLYCSMIRAGEYSGSMGDVLERLTYLLEHENKIRTDVASALRYPKIVLITLAGAFVFLLNWVIPSFARLFLHAKLNLPLPTKIALALNGLFVHYWPLMLAAVVGLVVLWNWWQKTSGGRLFLARFVLRIPVVGKVVQKAIMARFAAIFAILQRSGVGILESLDILSETIDNAAIEQEFANLREKLRAGQGISGPLSSARYFTPLTINMIAVGESAGNLERMLQDLAVHYDEEVTFAVGEMTEAIGPVLIVALAAVVGFFALAIFMPMWDMVQMAR